MTVSERGSLHSLCKGPEVGSVRGQCGRRAWRPRGVSELYSPVMGRLLLRKQPASWPVPATSQGGTQAWCGPHGPGLSNSQDCTHPAAVVRPPGTPEVVVGPT